MKDIKNVLVVMDKPKHDQVAFRRALRLERTAPMHLHLTAFCYHPMYDQTEVFDTHQRNEIKKDLVHDRERWLRDQVLDAKAVYENVTLDDSEESPAEGAGSEGAMEIFRLTCLEQGIAADRSLADAPRVRADGRSFTITWPEGDQGTSEGVTDQ